MNTKMQLCLEEQQEKCPEYKETCSRPGMVDLTCLYWRKDYLGKGKDLCDRPPKEKMVWGGEKKK